MRKLKYNIFVKLAPIERAMLRAAMADGVNSPDWGIRSDCRGVLADLEELMYGGPVI